MVFDRLDFGKHAFEPLRRVPLRYLAWVLREVEITPRFRDEIHAEIHRRQNGRSCGSHGGCRANPYPPPAALPALLTRAHRELVRQYHPDRGGSVDVMKGINLAFDRLRELVGAA